MFDGTDSISTAAIGAIPLAAAVLAQSIPDAGVGPYAPWTNLAAVSVIVGLFVWLITKHIPAREDRAEKRQDARDLQADARMDRIYGDFLASLATRDEISRKNAEVGNQAMQTLAAGQKDLMSAIKDIFGSIKALERKPIK